MSRKLRLLISCALSLGAVFALTPASFSACSGVEPSPAIVERKAVILRSAASAAIVIDAVRYLEDENWWEPLEIQVKNVSSKPVYFVEVDVDFPEVELDGVRRTLVAPFTYGRSVLMRAGKRAGPDDVPIMSGESYVLKIPSHYRAIQESLAVVKRVIIRVYSVSFGDDTGFKAGGVAFSSSGR